LNRAPFGSITGAPTGKPKPSSSARWIMATPVALEKFVGPAVHSHGRGDVGIHEGAFDRALVIPVHVHDVTVVSLMLSGAASERVAQGTRLIAAQDLIVTPAYAEHSYQFHEPGRWLNMQISDAWIARTTDGQSLLYQRSEVVHSGSAAAWAMRVRTEIHHRDSASQIAIDGAMMLMIADMARVKIDAASTKPRWLRRVEETLEASIAEPPSVESLAELAGVHPTHLLRTFRRYNGVTIANFVRDKRLQLARTRVATTDRPLSTIALEMGFADQSHFTRLFKQAFGETPGQYARSLRGR
jgi:AraC family transcriptional regulator